VRLFLDANVLFSAARNPEGRAAALFELARLSRRTLISSPHAVEEARRNLDLKHPEMAESLARLLRAVAICPEGASEAVEWAEALGLPLKDAPILAAAASARADFLVTGDRTHFGHLHGRRLRGVEVVTPANALEKLARATNRPG
jgi:predicted nucleic acid-binding protein